MQKAYDNELGENKVNDDVCYTQGDTRTKSSCKQEDIVDIEHIGLMYISDYLYGTLPEYWIISNRNYNNANVRNNNWM